MRSIRLSLVVYFTLLLAATVGTIFFFYYQDVTASVHTNEQNTRKLIETQYEREFDDHLLRRAHLMATLARPHPIVEGIYVLGITATAPGPLSHLPAAVWVEHSASRWLQLTQFQMRPPTILRFAGGDEFTLPFSGEDADEFLVMFRGDGKEVYRSESMPAGEFKLDDKLKKKLEKFPAYFDDEELKPGVPVRRVTIKVAVQRQRSVLIPLPTPNAKPGPPPAPDAPKKGTPPPPIQILYVQYAGKKDLGDEPLQGLQDKRDKRDKDLATLEKESAAARNDMHQRLIWLSLAAMVAIICGSIFLVHVTLKPLARLSEAVSHVSEKEIRLRFHDPRLPRELQPIVSRLHQALESLKRAFAREKQSAADISHELRTPLAALLTTLNVALRKQRTPEEYRELLEECRASGQQMTQLVERIMSLARLDSGVDQVREREVDVEGLADQCAKLVRPLAEARGLKLRVNRRGPAPLTTDPEKLREVLTNLLHNAIEYNRPEGSIDVDVERDNGHLRVEVRDTGIGINPEAQQHIFERFFRADPSRQSQGLHAGIGLAIVKGYVDLMGGAIEVDSIEGKGSTFRLNLPVRAAN